MSLLKFAAISIGLLATPLHAQDVLLTPQELYDASAAALRDGRADAAAQGADILRSVQPDSFAPLLLRTEAAIALEDQKTAVATGTDAFFAATEDREAFAAARLVALGHAQQENFTRAQIWLRIARQYAPTAAASTAVARDFRAVSRRNPWSTSFSFGVLPSSNINNGSASATTQVTESLQQFSGLFGINPDAVLTLSEDARALSGYEIKGGMNTSYRVHTNETSATFLTASADIRTYRLSDDAKEKAPDVSGRDFEFANLAFGVTHRFIGRAGDLPTTVSFQVSQAWYAQDPYSQTVSMTGSHGWAVTDADRLNLSLTLQRTIGLQDQDPTNTYVISGSWSHTFSWGDQARLGLSLRENDSDTRDSDFTSHRLTADYGFKDTLLGLNLGLGLDFEEKNYDDSRYDVGVNVRTDQSVTARLRAVVDGVEYFGFRPVITAEATQQESTIDLFDRTYKSIGFDLQSSF